MKETILELRTALTSAQERNDEALSSLSLGTTQIDRLQSSLKLADEAIRRVIKDRDLAEKLAAQETVRADKEHAEAHRNAVQRDILIYALALVGTVLVLTCAKPLFSMLPPQFTPYAILVWIAAAIGCFWGLYGVIRLALLALAAKL